MIEANFQIISVPLIFLVFDRDLDGHSTEPNLGQFAIDGDYTLNESNYPSSVPSNVVVLSLIAGIVPPTTVSYTGNLGFDPGEYLIGVNALPVADWVNFPLS